MEEISWNKPKFGTKELELVKKVLETGYVSEGPMTKELEDKLREVVRAKHIIMTTSATSALYLAIEADKRIRGYTEGEVIIPNLTFLATRQAPELAGLKIIIEDVDNNRFTLDREGGSYDSPNYPKIVIPVNLLGRKVYNFTEDTNSVITQIFDNAGCLGSNVQNGKVGCYSLQANKMINCGQGGFCATDDDEYAKVIRQIKDFGRENKDQQDTKGFNFKFNDIQAAVVLGQLEKLEEQKRLHIRQYEKYRNELFTIGKFIKYDLEEGEVPLWIEFITDKRDELFDYLKSKNIQCRKPWLPLIDNSERYPNTDYYCKNCIWLPNGASLTDNKQNEVIKEIKTFYGI